MKTHPHALSCLALLAGLVATTGSPAWDFGHPAREAGEQCTRQVPTTLREGAAERGMLIGAAIAMDPLRNDTTYTDLAKREFNIIVAENAFKWASFRPDIDTFNFTDTDALVAFAEANHMKIRGHTLVWHNQNPAWLTNGTWTRDQAIDILHNHISTLLGRYKGKILAWDVVNEAINDGSAGTMRDTFWLRTIGPDYIKLAFQFAHEADPQAKLYYNDYSIEGMSAKSNAVYAMVADLKAQGVPIDGVGWQSHFVNPFRISADNVTNARRLAGLGLDIMLTELDVRITLPTDATKLDQQALAYRDMLTFCLTEKNCKALLAWGVTDKFSWVPGVFAGQGDALPFDVNYQPKPAYTAMLDVLQQEPPTVPHELRARAGDGMVTLAWDRSRNTTSYNVKRATSRSGPYVLVSSITGTSFNDTTVTNGTTYFYAVSASNANEQSRDSLSVRAQPMARHHGRGRDSAEVVETAAEE